MQPGQVVLYELFLLITSLALLERTASPLTQSPGGGTGAGGSVHFIVSLKRRFLV